MRASTLLCALLVLLVAAALMPSTSWAVTTTKACPQEPKQNVPIGSGDTYTGSNCVLNTTGDVDSFIFTAAAGDTWSMDLGVGASPTTNICLTLYPPNSTTNIFSGCTNISFGGVSVAPTLKLTTAGTYTIVVNEVSNTTINYNLSLERISPAPADATALTLAKNVTGQVTPPTAQETYTFYGATTGTYQITASLASGSTTNVCFVPYMPDGTAVSSAQCTNVSFGGDTVSEQFTPTVNGTYVVVVVEGTNDGMVSYNLQVTCILGNCPQGQPKCVLKDAASYNATTSVLTMNFTLGTPVAVTWNGWLTSGSSIQSLWSTPETITEPAVTITQTASVPKSGVVGVLSTLTTTSSGITCSVWTPVNTK